MTELSPYLTYSSVVAHDGICLRFVSHRYWKCVVLNFAHECIRQIVIVVKSLCGLKSTGAAWYVILSSALWNQVASNLLFLILIHFSIKQNASQLYLEPFISCTSVFAKAHHQIWLLH